MLLCRRLPNDAGGIATDAVRNLRRRARCARGVLQAEALSLVHSL